MKFKVGDVFRLYCKTSNTYAWYRVVHSGAKLIKELRNGNSIGWIKTIDAGTIKNQAYLIKWNCIKTNHHNTKLGRILYK